MTTAALDLWIIPGLHLLAAILVGPATIVLRPFKSKIFILILNALSSAFCVKVIFSTSNDGIPPLRHFTTWPIFPIELFTKGTLTYLTLALSLGGFIAIALLPRQNFPRAPVFYLTLLALLEIATLASNLEMMTVAIIFAGLLISYPLCSLNSEDKSAKSLLQVILWHRLSDLLLIFSLVALSSGASHFFASALFLGGILLRASYLVAPALTCLTVATLSPIARTFYFFSMGLGPVVLVVKFVDLFRVSTELWIAFVVLNIISGLFAFVCMLLYNDLRRKQISIAFAFLAVAFIVVTFDNQIATISIVAAGYALLPLLFRFGKMTTTQSAGARTSLGELLLPGWRIDILIQRGWLKLCFFLASFSQRIIWPLILGLLIQVPFSLAVLTRWLLRLINAGGAQKAMATLLIGLLMFFVYYVEI